MAHVLPPLPYAYNALEPSIDEQTMRIHHDKHHDGYVNNLNTALKEHPDLAALSVEALIGELPKVPESIRTAVRNNGGGHYNHSLFWEIMKPGGPAGPTGALGTAITSTFGGVAEFKEQFQKAGMTRFGSGWAWLVQSGAALSIESTPNQDSPVMDGKSVLLGCDVWEHAYYLKYQNKRADYLAAWWQTVNWTVVGARYKA